MSIICVHQNIEVQLKFKKITSNTFPDFIRLVLLYKSDIKINL